MAAKNIADSIRAVEDYCALVPRLEPDMVGPRTNHATLREALGSIFFISTFDDSRVKEVAESVVEFAVDRRQPQAYILTKFDDRLCKNVYIDPDRKYDSRRIQEWVTLPGETLRALVAEVVADKAPQEWRETA